MSSNPEVKAEQQRRRYAARRAAGKCLSCHEPAAPGKVHCARHNLAAKIAMVRIIQRQIAARLCVWSGCKCRPSPNNKRLCEKHRQYHIDYRRNLRKQAKSPQSPNYTVQCA